MSIQIFRVVELAMRSACCNTIRSKSCLRKAGLATVAPPSLCVPALHRRAYSIDSLSSGPPHPSRLSSQQPHTEWTSPSAPLSLRKLSTASAKYDLMDFGDTEEAIQKAMACKRTRQFIFDPDLANLVAQLLELDKTKSVIFNSNPGPGLLTQALLKAGAQRVVNLERELPFIKDLQKLEGQTDAQLETVHCDFFKLDYFRNGKLGAFASLSETLFTDLGISPCSWTDDVPVKVVGIMSQNREHVPLMMFACALFQRQSIYRYGRVELNVFMSEKQYMKLISPPGSPRDYRSFGVFWRMSCDIDLLHKEPWESFVNSAQGKAAKQKKKPPGENLYLVRLRPRADLFSNGLTPTNASTLLVMIKQCLVKRKEKLIDRLNLWAPESSRKLLSEMGLPQDILTGDVFPEEYLNLFLLMLKNEEFKHSWLYRETQKITVIETEDSG